MPSADRTQNRSRECQTIAAMSTQAEIVARYPHLPLKDQVALVTGANSGIGEGVARYLSGAGAKVAINYVVNPEAANCPWPASMKERRRRGAVEAT